VPFVPAHVSSQYCATMFVTDMLCFVYVHVIFTFWVLISLLISQICSGISIALSKSVNSYLKNNYVRSPSCRTKLSLDDPLGYAGFWSFLRSSTLSCLKMLWSAHLLTHYYCQISLAFSRCITVPIYRWVCVLW
jgi:hypothetical protein